MRRSRQALTALAALTGLAMPAVAVADPPSADAYQILYYLTDADGNRSRQLTQQDMSQFVNRARCECGQNIIARITVQGTGYDQIQTEAYVGHHCDVAQLGITNQYWPCAQLAAGFPSLFQKGPEYSFDPVFLAWGVNILESAQTLEGAEPAGYCTGPQGNGGIWMCNGVTECMGGQFMISGDQNINIPDDAEPQGIAFDFQPPLIAPTDLKAAPGDGAVELTWNIQATGDINGYRVLCADADGNPLPNKGLSDRPAADAISNGTIYWTRENLCPDGGFGGDGQKYFVPASGDGDGDPMLPDVPPEEELPAEWLEGLSWEYVCSDHLGFSTRRARISGLENGTDYQFALIAYDSAGNPIVSDIITAAPAETHDFWELCEAEGDVCGDAGFCACTASPRDRGDAFAFAFALLGLGVWRRRRTRA